MYINYSIINGIEYGTATTSARNGNKVGKAEQTYLGRVIDKEHGVFKSRERGLFTYDVTTNTYGSVPPDYEAPKIERKTKYSKRPKLIVSFGDSFLLDEYLKQSGFIKAVDAIKYRNVDTLHALLSYYILSPHANVHAEDWWNLTYARFLYPKAQMTSQRISDALADIGSEDAKRSFFGKYLRFLESSSSYGKEDEDNDIDDGILIDSSGLPNSIRFPLTAVNNHNGVISEEVRLIYVVQQRTGMPLFFRYVAGNVVDVSTITRTIAELKANGVNTKFAILDAGYYTSANADALIDEGVSFIARMKSNFKVYKRAIKNHLDGLESRANAILYNKRLVYIKCIPCRIGKKEDKPAYAYLCKDTAMQHELRKQTIERAEDEELSGADIFDDLKKQGVFVLISTRKIAKDKLLPLYYMRDQVEKIFELCKQEGKILPINVENENTFRGHLMMTFMATVVLKMMSKVLKKTSMTTESMFMNLHEHHAVVYEKELITQEPVKKMNDAYNVFKVQCPVTIPRKAD
ncbi:MAG: transposase [Ruminiclostridium sp.]|nr:transposase [Ruminiclostridium sp.]